MITIQLQYPIEYEGKPFETISLRRPTGLDLRGIDVMNDMNTDKMAKLMVNLSELPMGLIDQLDASDFIAITKEITDFLG